MKTIADTNIWSQALRRKRIQFPQVVERLELLIQKKSIVMLGPIRQELLSGFKNDEQYERLKYHLRQFPDFPILMEDYEIAARFHRVNAQKGVQGSPIDYLICAVGYHNDFQIFTLDKDFESYAQHIPIKLYESL